MDQKSMVKKNERGSSEAKNGQSKEQLAKENSEIPTSQPTTTASNMEKSKTHRITPRIKRIDADTDPLLKIDETFRQRWHVEGIIGKGGYGEIYLVMDMKRIEEVAIKAEPKKRRGKIAKRMILEQKVLVKMQGKPHVPMVFASGHTDSINFIIMQLLSINLGEIRKASPVRKLGKSSVGRVLVQSIAALRDLHEAGYVHRDVKPANMCFGISKQNRHVLMLLDFGLVRRYKQENGEWRPARIKAGFRGTHRYVSIRVHARLEQTPCDDLTSLLYTAYELLTGELPWKSLEKNDEIRKVKESMQTGAIDYFVFNDLKNFSNEVFAMNPETDPDYKKLIEVCQSMIGTKKLSDLYDWEDGYKEAIDDSITEDSFKERKKTEQKTT